MNLYTRLSDLRNKTTFNTVEAISVNILIKTDFMDKYATSIYLSKRSLKPLSSRLNAAISTEASD